MRIMKIPKAVLASNTAMHTIVSISERGEPRSAILRRIRNTFSP